MRFLEVPPRGGWTSRAVGVALPLLLGLPPELAVVLQPLLLWCGARSRAGGEKVGLPETLEQGAENCPRQVEIAK